jgi:hypothetical protein
MVNQYNWTHSRVSGSSVTELALHKRRKVLRSSPYLAIIFIVNLIKWKGGFSLVIYDGSRRYCWFIYHIPYSLLDNSSDTVDLTVATPPFLLFTIPCSGFPSLSIYFKSLFHFQDITGL